jgi:hypothetical protein
MELVLDVLLGGLGYLLVRFFNRVFGTKVTFGDGGYIVTGFVFLAALIALLVFLVGRV